MGLAEAYGRVWGRTGLAKAITAAVREAKQTPTPVTRLNTTTASFVGTSGHTWHHTYPRMLVPQQVRPEHCPECDGLGQLDRVEWRRSGTMSVA